MANELRNAIANLLNTADELEAQNPRVHEEVERITSAMRQGRGEVEPLSHMVAQELSVIYGQFVRGVTPPTYDVVNRLENIVKVKPEAFPKDVKTFDLLAKLTKQERNLKGIPASLVCLLQGTLTETGALHPEAVGYVRKVLVVMEMLGEQVGGSQYPNVASRHKEFMSFFKSMVDDFGIDTEDLEAEREALVSKVRNNAATDKRGLPAVIPGSGPKAVPAQESEEDRWKRIEGVFSEFDQNIGLKDAKETLRDLYAYQLYRQNRADMGMADQEASLHVFMSGPPGTGKTTTAVTVGKLWKELGLLKQGQFIKCTAADLIAGYVGQTRLKTQKVIEQALGGVLFIDEAYSLATAVNGGENSGSFAGEAVEELVEAMETHRGDLIVIFAGYPGDMQKLLKMNPGLESRIGVYMDFPSYSQPELMQISSVMAKNGDLELTDGARKQVELLLEESRGRDGARFGNARTVRTILEQAQRKQADRLLKAGRLNVKKGVVPETEADKAARKQELSLITLEDVQKVKLGLGARLAEAAPVPQKLPIGFGDRFKGDGSKSRYNGSATSQPQAIGFGLRKVEDVPQVA